MKKAASSSYHLITLIICTLFIICMALYIISSRHLTVCYKPEITEESSSVISNPYRGFYVLSGYILSDDTSVENAADWCKKSCKSNPYPLMLLEVNLKNYADTRISSKALRQLDALLTECASAKKQVILRFLYDWDGLAMKSEPSDFYRIKEHMQQISATVNNHTDCIYIMQGVFTGNNGEMNNTNYSDINQVRQLAETLGDVISPDIYLSVRTPAQLRGILRSKLPLTSQDANNGSLASRLGLFNDGMLGSVYDLGTYDDTPLSSESSISEPGTRSEELLYQYKLCQYVPNGGEVTVDNEYNDLDNAIADLAQMHISYLNSQHDPEVLNKWRSSIYNGTDVFSGSNGYDYIDAHLGYRYLIKDSHLDFHSFAGDKATLYFTIENTGFSSAYKKFNTTLLIVNNNTSKKQELELSIDNRTIASQDKAIFHTELDVRSLEKGTYTLSLQMKDPYTKDYIHFANKGLEDNNTILLGTLDIK